MEIAFVELGSYSIKFLRGIVKRKTVEYLDSKEKILRAAILKTFDKDSTPSNGLELIEPHRLETVQFKVIEEYLQEYGSVEKIIINLPSNYSTLRLVSLPVKNRKKIERMVPFQLDDELPYPLPEAHLAIYPIIVQRGSYTIASSTHIEKFDRFFEHAQHLTCSPAAIVANESIYQKFVLENNLDDPIAIVDFGHRDSVCYLFYNSRLVGVETSFVGGRVVDDVISETYKIDVDEAIAFKHKDAFFLTMDQMDNVDEDQKNFSLLMKKIFSVFIDNFKRWDVSYQLKTRKSVKKMLITGGISNIKNMPLFLSQELGIQVSHFPYLERTELDNLGLSTVDLRSLVNCYGLSYHVTSKGGLSNFRNGTYAASGEREMHLDSVSFIGVRLLVACLIPLLVLIFENIYLSRIDKNMTKKISKILRDPSLKTTPAKRRKMIRDPENLFKFIEKKNKNLKKRVELVEEISGVNGVSSLAELSRIVKNSLDVELIKFENGNKNVSAVFKSEDQKILKSLENVLRSRNFDNMKVILKEENKELELTYRNVQR
ncbi:MAG: type II secretion system protein GspL [Bacteriovoracales bacterium]|nr:type II secretion system protein GspL [Bacteriovoracales bacterium]